MFLKRRRWTVRRYKIYSGTELNDLRYVYWFQVLLILILILMLLLNVTFMVDLTLNHDAHSEFVDLCSSGEISLIFASLVSIWHDLPCLPVMLLLCTCHCMSSPTTVCDKVGIGGDLLSYYFQYWHPLGGVPAIKSFTKSWPNPHPYHDQ